MDESTKEAIDFVNILERFVVAIIRNEQHDSVEYALDLINVKEELVKILSTIK